MTAMSVSFVLFDHKNDRRAIDRDARILEQVYLLCIQLYSRYNRYKTGRFRTGRFQIQWIRPVSDPVSDTMDTYLPYRVSHQRHVA